MISKAIGLKFLDDRPVFDDERRLVMAWSIGGHEGEVAERSKIAEEKAAEMKRDVQLWREMREKGRPLKEQREKEWEVEFAKKQIVDEAARNKNIQDQIAFMSSEMREREIVETTEYRATTALMQTFVGLNSLHHQHENEIQRLCDCERKQRVPLEAMDLKERDNFMEAFSNFKDRAPKNQTTITTPMISLQEELALLSQEKEINFAPLITAASGVILKTEKVLNVSSNPIISETYLPLEDNDEDIEDCEKANFSPVFSKREQTTTSTATMKDTSKPSQKEIKLWSIYLQWEQRQLGRKLK